MGVSSKITCGGVGLEMAARMALVPCSSGPLRLSPSTHRIGASTTWNAINT